MDYRTPAIGHKGSRYSFGMLSPRLAALSAAIVPGSRVADIGSDHGLLVLWLAQSGRASFCLATEKTPTLVARIARPPAGAAWGRRIAYRAGDGLAALRAADRIDAVVLAGLGGRTIVRILSGRPAALPPRLVLQPRTEERAVRRWLSDHGFRPVAESLTEERGRVHLTLAAEPGDDTELYRYPGLTRDDLLAAGPLLVRARPAALRRRWSAEHLRWAALAATGGATAEAERERAERVLAATSRRGG